MQATLFKTESPALDMLWLRAAIRECIEYGEHGHDTEINEAGREVCFNCRGAI
jgi:hypothetical protein